MPARTSSAASLPNSPDSLPVRARGWPPATRTGPASHASPSLSASRWCGSGGSARKLNRPPIAGLSQLRSGGAGGMQKSGYDGEHAGRVVVVVVVVEVEVELELEVADVDVLDVDVLDARHRNWESSAVVVQTIEVPALVTPVAPAAEQNAPGVTTCCPWAG